jgi:peptidoglycan/LPS O-acetylase OafA/YrhL
MPVDRPATPRIYELDALRGLAAVAVVLFHYTTRYDDLFSHRGALPFAMPGGYFGVDLFFMLSGFVILMTLERTADSWKFAWGRLTRLYPAYWVAGLITFTVVSLCGLPGQEVTPLEAVVNLTMIQGLLKTPHIDGAYWSLQAELIFYANMLLLYRLGAFRRVELTTICWVVTGVAAQLLLPFVQDLWPAAGSLLSKFTTITSLKYIPLFGLGLLIYSQRRQHMASWLYWFALSLCCLGIGLIDGVTAALTDAGLAGVLWLAVSGRAPGLAARPLVWLGAISYTLYLTHQNIGYVLIRNLESRGASPLMAIIIACVASVVLATCLHRCVERPSMRLLRNWKLPSLRSRLGTAPVASRTTKLRV